MRDSDMKGEKGEAWTHRGVPSEAWPAALGHWLVRAPDRHPFWEDWMVSVVHLRPVPGETRAAHLKYPKAEHELVVLALEPGKPVDPDGPDWPFMQGPELVFQFDGLGDEGARKLGEGYVKAILAGGSPDSDFRSWWERTLTHVVRQMKDGRKHVNWAPMSQSKSAH